VVTYVPIESHRLAGETDKLKDSSRSPNDVLSAGFPEWKLRMYIFLLLYRAFW